MTLFSLILLVLMLSILTGCAAMDTTIPLADGRVAHVRSITVIRAARTQLVQEPTAQSLILEMDPPPPGLMGLLETAIPALLTFIIQLL